MKIRAIRIGANTRAMERPKPVAWGGIPWEFTSGGLSGQVLIGGNIVAAPYEKIAEVEIIACDEALPAQIQVSKFHLLALGDAKPPVHARRLRELGRILAITTRPWIYRLIISIRIIRSARRLRQILA